LDRARFSDHWLPRRAYLLRIHGHSDERSAKLDLTGHADETPTFGFGSTYGTRPAKKFSSTSAALMTSRLQRLTITPR
jgi:hypothetical protein